MQRTFSIWCRAGLLALAGTLTISAQTAGLNQISAPANAGAQSQGKPKTTSGTPALPIIPPGASITWTGTDAPGNYTASTTFSSTKVSTDNGAVNIWQEQVATGTTGEWDIFYMETTDGGPLANNLDADWAITVAFTLNWPVFNDGVVTQW